MTIIEIAYLAVMYWIVCTLAIFLFKKILP